MSKRQYIPIGRDYKRYDPDTFDVIPLHKPRAKQTIQRKGESITINVGKRPLHPRWTTIRYSFAKVVARCVAEARNMGIRLKPGQLVIDVDVRHGGIEGLAELESYLGIDLGPDAFPRVLTGSGGFHIYMTIPDGLKVLDTIGDRFPGVEFKSAGRQVLAAGCVHPDTGKRYAFVAGRDINDLPPAPARLVKLIRRKPKPANETKDGGHISPARLAAALEGLNPERFRDHEAWLQLMMACHHATGGEGRTEFVNFSTADPEYADHAEQIGRRWDSLHAERNDGVTVASLNRQLVKAKRPDLLLPERSAADVFAESPIPFKPEVKAEPRWPRGESWFKRMQGVRRHG